MRDDVYRIADHAGTRIDLTLVADDDHRTVDHVDGRITTADGITYAAPFLTTAAIDTVLARWSATGGSFFYCTDLIVIPQPGTDAIICAVGAMVTSG